MKFKVGDLILENYRGINIGEVTYTDGGYYGVDWLWSSDGYRDKPSLRFGPGSGAEDDCIVIWSKSDDEA
tara:strand:- start:1422 stop:1631 length:210 start_codon:yes stop_codon:yes gene_type:complete